MKKYCYGLFVTLLFGLCSFSEGKSCPERTRPHKSRCDAYYKCTELKADKHVWMPTNCEEGLVYEHSLTVCVLPADDWECLIGDHRISSNLNKTNNKQHKTKPNTNKDSDIYIISNGADEDSNLNNKYEEDDNVEIIIGSDLSDEDTDDNDEDENEDEEEEYKGGLFVGSGDGVELVELDGILPAENRKAEIDDEVIEKAEEKEVQKTEQKEEELEEMLQTIKTKVDMGQASTNIDPKLTGQLQRLSQLIDGLKQNYQPQTEQTLRPDQLNAFLAHFTIKNKIDALDPSENFLDVNSTTASVFRPNKTLYYKHESNVKLKPETKVVLQHHYDGNNFDSGNSGGGYSNSQIVLNHPEGSVLFNLPEHHYMEKPSYSFDNTPKISEETLKTVLELSKQMIAQQNFPKIVPNPTYYASPMIHPILLTQHADSPFSSNYIGQNSNSPDLAGQYNNGGAYNQNNKYKNPIKRPLLSGGYNGHNDNGNGNYESSDNNIYGTNHIKPSGATIIHNNVIPVHVSATNSGEKDVFDSYGQNLALYPPLYGERPDSSDHHGNFNSNNGPFSGFHNNMYSVSTTKRPSYESISATSSPYGSTQKPYEFQTTASTISQYFTPSEHLDDHNVNNVFSSVDNYGSMPRPMKHKKPNLQNYKPAEENNYNEESYGFQNQLFPQVNSHKVHVRPNSQNFESFESENYDLLNNYQDSSNGDEPQIITYSYGNKKKPGLQSQFSSYGDSGKRPAINTVFSSNNPYIPRPESNSHSNLTPSYNSYYSQGKNNYTPISSAITTSYGEGTQLVNMGGNFISFDVFQNSILPLMGNNPSGLSSSLSNVEVITCATGVRQPNTTDCTRYYVCSKKDGKVLSHSCPPYTAFNSNTRICDAKTYALCNTDPIVSSYSVAENKRIQMETLKAIQEAKRHPIFQQQQDMKSQKQYDQSTSALFNNPLSATHDSTDQNMLQSYMQHTASLTTTPRPQLTTQPTTKKYKYYCKEGDKIADQSSIYNYFVCYKNAKGQMKGHRMTCSNGLLFCSKPKMCTLPSKCS